MKPGLWVLNVALLVGTTAVALEVPLRDGSVVEAESYRITGSYVMMILADGSQIAYDVADVDLEALRAAKARGAVDGDQEDPNPVTIKESLSGGRSLKTTDRVAGGNTSQLMITDGDVKHVQGSGVRGNEEQLQMDGLGDDGLPEGYQQGGRVILNGVRVSPVGAGQWQIEGDVINRDPAPVFDVSVRMETTAVGSEEPWSEELPVASYLGPDEKVSFNHNFAAEAAEGNPTPTVRAHVVWTRGETRRMPSNSASGRVTNPGYSRPRRGGSPVPTPVG